MKRNSENFFTDDEKKSIENAVKKAEEKTSGEIAVVVVESSDRYNDVDTFTGIIISALISVIPSESLYINSEYLLRKIFTDMAWITSVPDGMRYIAGLSLFILMTILLFFPSRIFFRKLPWLKRLIISDSRLEHEVNERALRAFYDHGLSYTKDGTGVLFLISLLERKVRILADRGIYAKVRQEKLDRYASSIGQGIASGRGYESLCEAITDVGEELRNHFPVKPDDINEIPDRVITE